MCDENQIASKLKRNSEEDFTANLKRDIESFFAQKYGTLSCQFHRLVAQQEEMAQVDFTVSGDSNFSRRYVGNAGYVDGHLSLARVIRLM
jgi:hypothetical protein